MAVLPKASFAVTVTVTAVPAVDSRPASVTVEVLAAAGLTVIVALVPVIELVTVSVAVSDWLPAVLRVTREGVVAVVAGDEGVVRRQGRLAVGAGEVDRAGVAGGRVAEGVLAP